MAVKYAKRMDLFKKSELGEILKLIEEPDIISFAGGLPASELFPVEEMKKEDAVKSGAECMFIEKYPEIVTVYSIGDVSKELCGGPHVSNTSEIGKFKIKKEEASSAGIRRIKAVIEK